MAAGGQVFAAAFDRELTRAVRGMPAAPDVRRRIFLAVDFPSSLCHSVCMKTIRSLPLCLLCLVIVPFFLLLLHKPDGGTGRWKGPLINRGGSLFTVTRTRS
jgi:hypothetical protein